MKLTKSNIKILIKEQLQKLTEGAYGRNIDNVQQDLADERDRYIRKLKKKAGADGYSWDSSDWKGELAVRKQTARKTKNAELDYLQHTMPEEKWKQCSQFYGPGHIPSSKKEGGLFDLGGTPGSGGGGASCPTPHSRTVARDKMLADMAEIHYNRVKANMNPYGLTPAQAAREDLILEPYGGTRQTGGVTATHCPDGCPPGTVCTDRQPGSEQRTGIYACRDIAEVTAAIKAGRGGKDVHQSRIKKKAKNEAAKEACTGAGFEWADETSTVTYEDGSTQKFGVCLLPGNLASSLMSDIMAAAKGGKGGNRKKRYTARVGRARRNGLTILRKAGFDGYDDFYKQLGENELLFLLEPHGEDKKWGPRHSEALKRFKDVTSPETKTMADEEDVEFELEKGQAEEKEAAEREARSEKAVARAEELFSLLDGLTGFKAKKKIRKIIDKSEEEGNLGALYSAYDEVLQKAFKMKVADPEDGDLIQWLKDDSLPDSAQRVAAAVEKSTETGTPLREFSSFPEHQKLFEGWSRYLKS